MKKALVTGITGQDGRYLTEYLMDLGYEVWGVIRRSSDTRSIAELEALSHSGVQLRYGDMTDAASLRKILAECAPDEIYNLAAQSHVRISFDIPEYTSEVNGTGVINLLEAMREIAPNARLYHASTSELFGSTPPPQSEKTPFHPRSPYGVAKLQAYWGIVNYRESYDMFASQGILFNHECFDANTPIIIRKNNLVSVEYMRNLLPERKDMSKDNNILTRDVEGIEVWNGSEFTNVKTITRRKIRTLDKENQCKKVFNTRHGSVKVTPNHKLIDDRGEKKEARSFEINDSIKHGSFPVWDEKTLILEEEAELLGMLVGDGYVGKNKIRLSNNDDSLLERFYYLSKKIYGDVYYRKSEGKTEYGYSKSIDISGIGKNRINALRDDVYDIRSGHKKVPFRVLNADRTRKESFFTGYYACDGLKKDKCTYKFKSFKSNSPILCQGLLLVMSEIASQDYNINVFKQNGKEYHQINFNSDKYGNRGSHLKLSRVELKKIIDSDDKDNCYVYDIETDCGFLNAGVGTMVVGNSPRRGDNFVTRKITKAAARIHWDKQDCLYLGNVDAKRDWGFAGDYVKAMHLMLQHDSPGEFVIATGEAHSVREFMTIAFDKAGFNLVSNGKEGIEEEFLDSDTGDTLVKIDPRFYRPAEVEYLLGDPTKAKNELGWKLETSFEELVEMMVEHDLEDNNEH
jgi:GDPmannose 4,6-dehydratase